MGFDRLTHAMASLRRLPASAVDAGLALIFIAAVAVGRVLDPLPGGMTVASVVLTVVLAGSVWLRRQIPLTAFVASSVALCVESLLGIGSAFSPYANQLGAYSLGLYATRTRALWGPPIIVAGVVGYFTVTTSSLGPLTPIGVLFVWLATWILGYSTARRREEEERARRAIARQVVAEERTRLARELHDVVAHHVSVIGLLAAATRRTIDRDPGRAKAALTSIEDSSRQAVAEMHRLLGFLREESDANQLAPPPNLRQLDALAAQLSEANLSIDVQVEGDERVLPTSIDMSAYRVVQEALTNTIKHAEGATTAQVRVRYRPKEVEVEIVDDGLSKTAVPSKRTGHGLIGMRERVGLHGGRLTAGPRPGGGYTVHAVFPLDQR